MQKTKTPYMTKRHFIVLADELGADKFYYNSKIAYHEKLERMLKYCQEANAMFDDKTKVEASRTVGGTI